MKIAYNTTVNETLLWQRLIDGDLNVLETFYRLYYDLLFNYGLKYCSDNELVRDSIQDLFVNLHKSKNLRYTDYVKAYFMKALRNILFDKLAQRKNKISLEENTLNFSIDDHGLELLFDKNDKDILLSKQILETYKGLPKNQKMIIYLRYIRGLSYKEISAIMEINVQSSMNLANRALSNMRKQILQFIIFFI